MLKFSGVFIAPITPVKENGQINFLEFERLLDFLLEGGVDGVCVGGGTSEYPRFELSERCRLITAASRAIAGRGKLLASVGTASYSRTLELARYAEQTNVDALLLPMPHFYSYEQADLEQFCSRVGRSLGTAILLYNLPSFTNELKPETAIRLLKREANFVGIKDSSGDMASIRNYAEARRGDQLTLLMGTDKLILDALEAGWDGSISGIGNFCPELLSALLRSYRRGDREQARECQDLILRISEHVNKFPFPWAVRAGLEVRGIRCGPGALPLSATRAAQLKEFQAWLEGLLESDLRTAIRPANLRAVSA